MLKLIDKKCCDNPKLVLQGDELQSYTECENCGCLCNTPGKDDSQITCFMHHDCSLGYCTHQDNDDEGYSEVHDEDY